MSSVSYAASCNINVSLQVSQPNPRCSLWLPEVTPAVPTLKQVAKTASLPPNTVGTTHKTHLRHGLIWSWDTGYKGSCLGKFTNGSQGVLVGFRALHLTGSWTGHTHLQHGRRRRDITFSTLWQGSVRLQALPQSSHKTQLGLGADKSISSLRTVPFPQTSLPSFLKTGLHANLNIAFGWERRNRKPRMEVKLFHKYCLFK